MFFLGGGQNRRKDCAILIPNKLVFTFGSLRRCQFGWKSIKNATVKVQLADGHWYMTDANRFYNLSHAICYSYGTDKWLRIVKKSHNSLLYPHIKFGGDISLHRRNRRMTSQFSQFLFVHVTVDWLLLTRWRSVVRHVTMRARATRRVVSWCQGSVLWARYIVLLFE